MAAFACRTRDAAGQVVERTIDADSRRDAMRLLEECGLSPIEITEVLQHGPAISGNATEASQRTARGNLRLKRKELRRFSIQLGSSLKAGVPILGALTSISQGTEDEKYRALLAQMMTDVEGGLPLSGAMRNQPKAFPGVYVGTIEAGEKSGTLDEMLDNLAEYLEAEIEARADVRSALLYPAIVIGSLCLAITVLIVFVVPRFAEFYSGFDTELPLPTRILISGSELLANHGLAALIVLVALAYGGIRLVRIEKVRGMLDRKLLRLPLIGHFIETAIVLRFAQMLGLFTKAGVPMLEALRTIASATGNTKIREDLQAVAAGIEAGETLAHGLEATGCCPPDARQMIATGERTGSLDRACSIVTEQYKKELHYLTKNSATFIEPLLTLVLACVVLFVALAVFLPMWDLSKVVH